MLVGAIALPVCLKLYGRLWIGNTIGWLDDSRSSGGDGGGSSYWINWCLIADYIVWMFLVSLATGGTWQILNRVESTINQRDL